MEAEVQRDVTKFRDLYIFSFSFAKNPNQKGIELEMAIPYWNILLHGRFTLLGLWTQFLQVWLYDQMMFTIIPVIVPDQFLLNVKVHD